MSAPVQAPHVRQRIRERWIRLEQLGYSSYPSYLRSKHWAETKERYRASDRPQECYCCGATETHLHHLTYERIGEELLEDLTPLCRPCHGAVHVLENRGDIGLDLVGLMDSVRAQHGKQVLAQVKTQSEQDFASAVPDLYALLDPMTYEQRLARAFKTAGARKISLKRELFVMLKMKREGRSQDALRSRLLAMERKVYAREFQAAGQAPYSRAARKLAA